MFGIMKATIPSKIEIKSTNRLLSIYDCMNVTAVQKLKALG